MKLGAIAQHLEYELKMLWAVGAEILKGTYAPTWPHDNALLESFALHARNLIDFFYADDSGDDVVAQHFFSEAGKWNEVRPPLSVNLKKAKERANKEITHLTYSRLKMTPDTKPWPVPSIMADLEVVFAAFLREGDRVPERVRLLRYRNLLP